MNISIKESFVAIVITLSFLGLEGQTPLVMGRVVGQVEGGAVLLLTASYWVGLVD